MSEIELPGICHGCAKSKGSSITERCDFCKKTDFPESILCDLNRSVQGADDFSCHSFAPLLEVASPIPVKSRNSDLSHDERQGSQRTLDFQKTLFSDKFKYERAFVLQKLNRDPDFISMNLKFHFAWNVSERRPLFFPENEYAGFVHETFIRCSDLVGGFSSLIWLAPDHVHVYVESDGMQSPETIQKRLKEFSRKEIMKEFPDLEGEVDSGVDLWDEAYFVETVG